MDGEMVSRVGCSRVVPIEFTLHKDGALSLAEGAKFVFTLDDPGMNDRILLNTGSLGSALTGTLGGYDTSIAMIGNNMVLTLIPKSPLMSCPARVSVCSSGRAAAA
jgi:hypothetical protein